MSEENINLSKSNNEVNTKNMNEYNKQTYDNQAYSNYNNNLNYNSVENNYTPWLIAGIVQLMCCNQITGIITILFSFLANEDYTKGSIDEYKSKIKCAKIATIIGVILSALIYVCIIVFYAIIFILAMFE